jgi:hypothetical protein
MDQIPYILPGTLEMLILNTLSRGLNHGWGIAQRIQQVSEDALKIGEGSLYPALRGLLLDGCAKAEWLYSQHFCLVRVLLFFLISRRVTHISRTCPDLCSSVFNAHLQLVPSVLRHPGRYVGQQVSLTEFIEDAEKHSG